MQTSNYRACDKVFKTLSLNIKKKKTKSNQILEVENMVIESLRKGTNSRHKQVFNDRHSMQSVKSQKQVEVTEMQHTGRYLQAAHIMDPCT